MAQNTKLAGYNAGATPLTGVNPVHTIQFTGNSRNKGCKRCRELKHIRRWNN